MRKPARCRVNRPLAAELLEDRVTPAAVGVSVGVGDIDGDGYADVVAGAEAGATPEVKVFSGKDGSVVRDFLAFDPGFTGGVSVAVGDVTGDGHPDVVVGAGDGGGPEVKVDDGPTGAVLRDFFAYEDTFRGGVNVAGGDVDGDGRADVVAGSGPLNNSMVQITRSAGSPLVNFSAFDNPGPAGGFAGLSTVPVVPPASPPISPLPPAPAAPAASPTSVAPNTTTPVTFAAPPSETKNLPKAKGVPAAGLPPEIVVGRALSASTVGDVQNHQETITYTVYNEQAGDVSGVLLTTTLRPGITLQSATAPPDRSGQNLAWSLGTGNALDVASLGVALLRASGIPARYAAGTLSPALARQLVGSMFPRPTRPSATYPTAPSCPTP